MRGVKKVKKYLNMFMRLPRSKQVIFGVLLLAVVAGAIWGGAGAVSSLRGAVIGHPFTFPVPGYKVGRNDYKPSHKGWDIPAPDGTPIVAGDDGVVDFVGSKPGKYGGMTSCGTYVQIKHHNKGVLVTYCHMSRTAALSKGDTVRRGQMIGYVGSTGHSTGPHLHLTVWRNGNAIDPGDFFPRSG